MKIRFFTLILAGVLLFSSCQKPQSSDGDLLGGEIIETSEPQYMAYRLGEVMQLGEDIFLQKVYLSQKHRSSLPNTEARTSMFTFPALMLFVTTATACNAV